MEFTIDDRFAWFLEQFGDPQQNKAVTPAILSKFKGKLPRQLLAYWQEYGFCSFKDGLFFIVNPDDYRGAMESWLSGTDILTKDNYYVIARSGFGDLFLWGEKSGNNYIIEPRNCRVFSEEGDQTRIDNGLEDEAIRGFFAVLDPEDVDYEDIKTDRPIFAQAVKQFGALAEDEMFTFEPALFLGGEQTIKTVNKVNIHIQLELLAKMGEREIMDINGLAKKAFGS